ncbi:MAG: toll/interleukin-1 receptor domain-containing protein, partial [Clostridia bacterium]|nr:toll/interleukin-1 receptor domain-containing protein [Clostridia bacterium]
MALFRCKMCGGALELQGLSEVVQCAYCGTKQTIPRISDDKRGALYDRAGSFRRNSEFDKAAALYEEILGEDPTDAEAYWSLVLCRYGIVYVSDPATNRKIPTVNRVQYTSVFDDENYKFALKYATPGQQEVYHAEAEAINEIQKRYLAISQREEPFDVFICYKETDEAGNRTPDSVLAQELYYELTEAGFKVFFARITLENKLGCDYEPYIFSALHSSKLMVVLGTKPEYFNAVWVKNEWSRFIGMIGAGEKKVLIPAYRDMDPYLLPPEFSHLQALDMAKLGFMQDLIHGIRKILGESAAKASGSVGGSDAGEIASYLKRIRIFLDEGSFNQAASYCEKVLDRDPENGEAYFLKLQAQLRVSRETALADYNQPLDTLGAYRTALRFADPATKDKLERYNTATRTRYDGQLRAQNQARLAEEQRKQAEALAHQQYQYQRQTQIRNDVIELEAKRKK